MANIKLIKKRTKSAKNISKITYAMQMVAASYMRKAQEQVLKGKPYQEKILEAVFELSEKTDWRMHPLLKKDNLKGKILIILISTNKGLCGALNNNLFRKLKSWFSNFSKINFITLGTKGQEFIISQETKLLADFSNSKFLESVPAITQLFVQGFMKEEIAQVFLVFNRFVSFLKQEPAKIQILPLSIMEEAVLDKNKKTWREFLIEPSIQEVLNSLIPHYLEVQLRSAILEASASEHSARMIAMKNATDNAKNLIYDLTLEYNKLRQEKITYEIADMVTARQAVE